MKRYVFLFGTLLVFCWLPFFSGCDVSRTPPPANFDAEIGEALSYGAVTEHFDEGAQVKVEVSAAWVDDQWAVVRGVFTPADEGYHLYSKDLPREGLEGIGRPTLIEAGKAVKRSGGLTANVDTKIIKSFGKNYPVYPDGPVTLYRLLIPEDDRFSVKLTYMACSAKYCNQPVVGAKVSVKMPDSD